MVDQILSSRQISRQQHLLLTSTILSDRELADEDRRQINRVFDNIQVGRLKIVD